MVQRMDNTGFLIGIFVAILLASILVPFVMDASAYKGGEYLQNQEYTFIADTTSNFSNGHYSVTDVGVTSYNTTYLSFDGATGLVNTSSSELPIGDKFQNWTFVANVYVPSTNTGINYTLAEKYGDTTNNPIVIGIGDGQFFVTNDETIPACLIQGYYLNATPVVDRWVQVAVSFGVYEDVTKASSNMTFYLDGVKMNATKDATQDAVCPVNWTDGYLAIGKSTNWGAWNGYIDYVRVYNETISDADITAQFTAKQERGLIREWKFNENTGAAAKDAITDNSGVITAATWANDAILSTVSTSNYAVDSDLGKITLTATGAKRVTGNLYDTLTWTYDYDNRVGMGAGVSTIVMLVGVLFVLAILAWAFLWIRSNLGWS